MNPRADSLQGRQARTWQIAYWILLLFWVIGAGLTMSRVAGGLLTSYLSDLTFPPWFYIVLRGKIPGATVIRQVRWFGGSPARAAMSIFIVGAFSELSQYFWPQGPIVGTFDPIDLVAYAAGLLLCYFADISK